MRKEATARGGSTSPPHARVADSGCHINQASSLGRAVSPAERVVRPPQKTSVLIVHYGAITKASLPMLSYEACPSFWLAMADAWQSIKLLADSATGGQVILLGTFYLIASESSPNACAD